MIFLIKKGHLMVSHIATGNVNVKAKDPSLYKGKDKNQVGFRRLIISPYQGWSNLYYWCGRFNEPHRNIGFLREGGFLGYCPKAIKV
jgi:hypothetical protein